MKRTILLMSILAVLASGCHVVTPGDPGEYELPKDMKNVSWWKFSEVLSHRDVTQTEPDKTMARNLFSFGPPPRPPVTVVKNTPKPPPPPPRPVVKKVETKNVQPKPQMPPFMREVKVKGLVLKRSGEPKFAILEAGNEILIVTENETLQDNIYVKSITVRSVVLATRDGRFEHAITVKETNGQSSGRVT